MQNTLLSTWRQPGAGPGADERADRPQHRLFWLAAAMVLVLSGIGGRLAYVQTVLPDGLLDVFEITTESEEDIPARDGRILSADGVILADNEEQFDLLVYYRWIEEPANQDWVRHRALQQLNRSERRKAERVAAAEAAVMQRREDLWNSLTDLTGVSPEEFRTRRAKIQTRVEKTWQRVEAARATPTEQNSSTSGDSKSLLELLAEGGRHFWRELTTAPPRTTNDPLIITEQEDEHLVLANLDAERALEIETHPERYPGVRIVVRSRRVYPEKDLAAHLIGNRTALKPDELSEHAENSQNDFQSGESLGRSGLERSYDALLRGRRGKKRIVRNRRREIVHTEVVREARAGQDLVVTFDTQLQQRSEQLLDELLAKSPTDPEPGLDEESNRATPALPVGPHGGCIVALDVRTGAILAAAAAPRFDLNLLVHPDPQQWQALLNDSRRPLFPRVTQMALPPGSTFKTLSAIALVEDGDLDPHARFLCQGYLDQPNKDRCLVFRHYGVGHNETNLADALCRSCNVFFFTAARRSGPEPLIDWSGKLGFGQPTGIDLPGETGGSLPSPKERESTSRRPWYPGDTLGLVIGQSSLLVTPLQMARLMAAVANEGELVTPYLGNSTGLVHRVAEVKSPSEDSAALPMFSRPEPKRIQGLHAATLEPIRDGLERVVQDKHGTAYKTVRLPNVKIAGKTGTAEVGGRLPDHAWFAGYVPAEAPRVAFVVVIEHGGSGGKVAGPVAKEFVKSLLELGVIHSSKELAKDESE